jgi:hypothetical protein
MATYAGISLLINHPQVDELLATFHKKQKILEFEGLSQQPSDLGHLPYSGITAPKVDELGRLHWPQGASDYAFGHFLVDDERLEQIRPVVYSGNTLNSAVFAADDGSTLINTDLYMLAPRPISQTSGKNNLWLMTLVDERYWWWYKQGTITISEDTTTWDELYDQFESILGVTIENDAIDPFFNKPTRRFAYANEAIPVLLDACAYSVGQRIIREFDGTVKAQNPGTARAVFDANLAAARLNRAFGGKLYVEPDGSASGDHLATVPKQTRVIFPKENTLTGEISTTYGVDITVSSTGIEGKQALWGDQIAAVTGDVATPNNLTDLTHYASALSVAWYQWQTGRAFDLTYKGLQDWTPEGYTNSIEYLYEKDLISTRILSCPRNDRNIGGNIPNAIASGLDCEGVCDCLQETTFDESLVTNVCVSGGILTFTTASGFISDVLLDGISIKNASTHIVRGIKVESRTHTFSECAVQLNSPVTCENNPGPEDCCPTSPTDCDTTEFCCIGCVDGGLPAFAWNLLPDGDIQEVFIGPITTLEGAPGDCYWTGTTDPYTTGASMFLDYDNGFVVLQVSIDGEPNVAIYHLDIIDFECYDQMEFTLFADDWDTPPPEILTVLPAYARPTIEDYACVPNCANPIPYLLAIQFENFSGGVLLDGCVGSLVYDVTCVENAWYGTVIDNDDVEHSLLFGPYIINDFKRWGLVIDGEPNVYELYGCNTLPESVGGIFNTDLFIIDGSYRITVFE